MSSGEPDPAARSNVPEIDAIAGVRPALGETVQFLEHGIPDPTRIRIELDSPNRSRRGQTHFRFAPSLERSIADFVTTAAGLVAQESSPEDDDDFAAGLIRNNLKEETLYMDPATMLPPILASVAAMRKLQGFAETTTAELDEAAQDDSQQLSLMKLLALRPTIIDDRPDADEIHALQVLYAFTALSQGEAALHAEIEEKLKRGGFDSVIGEELLRSAASDDSSVNEKFRNELGKLIKLGTFLSGDTGPEEAIAKLTSSDGLELWPDELRKLLHERRSFYERDMAENFAASRQFLNERRCNPSGITEGAVGSAAENLVFEISTSVSKNTSVPFKKRLGAQATAASIKRKRQPKPEGEAPAAGKSGESGQQPPEPEADTTRKPMKLTYVLPDGSEVEEGTPEFNQVFATYATKNRGQSSLTEDLDRLRGYLKSMDLSQGMPRGIGPYRFGSDKRHKRDERGLPPAYQLDLTEVVGLSVTSKAAQKMRVIFMHQGDEIRILSIDPGDSAAKLANKVSEHQTA